MLDPSEEHVPHVFCSCFVAVAATLLLQPLLLLQMGWWWWWWSWVHSWWIDSSWVHPQLHAVLRPSSTSVMALQHCWKVFCLVRSLRNFWLHYFSAPLVLRLHFISRNLLPPLLLWMLPTHVPDSLRVPLLLTKRCSCRKWDASASPFLIFQVQAFTRRK